MAQYAEKRLQNRLLQTLGSRQDVRCWRNNVGVARPLHDEQSVIRYGIPGMSDLFLVVRLPNGFGAFGSIECKTKRGKVSEEQAVWLKVIERFGGFAHLSRLDGAGSIDEQIDRAEARCLEALDEYQKNGPEPLLGELRP